MKLTKRIANIMLAVVMAVGMFSAFNVSANNELRPYEEDENTKIIDGVVYVLQTVKSNNTKYYVVEDFFATDENAKTAKSVNILSKVDGIPVKIIDPQRETPYIHKYSTVKKITIPNSILKINEYSFNGFNKVKSLVLPSSLKYIGADAFATMSSLEKIAIPKNVQTIHRATFAGCKSLSKISKLTNVKVVCSMAFDGCKSLKTITLGKKLVKIQYKAFLGCKNLTKIKILSKKALQLKTFSLYGLPKSCKIYVVNKTVAKSIKKTNFKGKVIIKKDLK